MVSPSASGDFASLADFARVLRQRKLLVLGLTLLVVATTAVITALRPKWFLSTAQVRVERPDGEVKLFAQSVGGFDPSHLQDQFRIMQSPKILRPVAERLSLGERLAPMVGSPAALPMDVVVALLRDRMLQLESPRGSSLIEINVLAQEPTLAAEIANAIASVFAEDRAAFATSEQREGLAQLRRELDVQERNVSAQRDRIEALRDELNLAGVDLSARYSDLEIETLRQMQNSLIAHRVEAIGRRTRWERFRSIPFEERINLINSELIADTNIQSLLQAYLLADQTVTRLQARLGAAHPDLIGAVENRAKIREQLDGQLRGYDSSLEIASKEAEARVTELERQLGAAKVEQILSARERLRPFEEAAQKLDDETRLLTTLKLTLRQREIDFQVPKRTIELLGEAQPARRPAKPNWPLNLLLALVGGAFLGLATAGLIEYFDTTVRTMADVENGLGLTVLGVVPRQDDFGPPGAIDPVAAEPYRVLHTNVNLGLVERRSTAMMAVSAGPGEGKSTTLHRLATVMAAAGERVVLIDGDLRRPSQHRLGGWQRSPGLAELLADRVALDDVLQRTGAGGSGFDFVASGESAEFTVGVAHAPRWRTLLETLRGRYDKILVDSPPIIGVSDAAVLAGAVDGVLLVVQHRRHPLAMILRAKRVLTSLRTPILGAVLNQVPLGSGEDYSYYTANYAYYGQKSGRRARETTAGGQRGAGAGRGDPERLELDPPDIDERGR